MAKRIFESSTITFTDDELATDGDGHNRTLLLTVKCEGYYVKMSFEAVSVDHFKEEDPIIQPCLSSSSSIVATTMLKYSYQLGKGLGLCSQEIVDPITLLGNQGTSGLEYKQSKINGDKAKNHKRTDWELPQPIPHISHSFFKPQGLEMEVSFTHENIEEVIQDLSQLFCEVNMVQVGEGTSHADV
ncbi:hypothetical protein R3W88_004530 [Solanum pinnatisectum]|uniref:Uncharacterized protein n=1 Tax=Solanum pinnatisectum TaxID=50273 RepID=A0AAV9K9M9_9SOLN|nr:hypothetical protein R3W88_004530 [Solanum pinnatisectum]